MSSSTVTSPTLPGPGTRRRTLLLRDSLVFLALCGVSITLFLVTLLLFRSFEAHREDLGRRWAARGQAALAHGHPAEAVSALRTALTHHDDLPGQLLLAQALVSAGRTEEATNYFLNLRETRPGDGLINLQLARLYRLRGDAPSAIDDYRAAIFGNWEGDGTLRRRDVRLELAGYLAERGNRSAARDELLIAAGNTPDAYPEDILFGDRLQAVGDTPDALAFYNKALHLMPRSHDALARAGRAAYALGDFDQAYKLLSGAVNTLPTRPTNASQHTTQTPASSQPERQQLEALAANAHRLPELSLSRTLPAAERADHLLLAARIAQARLSTCVVNSTVAASQTSSPAPNVSPSLQMLRSRWLAAAPEITKRALARDAALEDNLAQLIDDTETGTVVPCGPPQGDDALLLQLATASLSQP